MVCTVTGVSSTESSVRSFTPPHIRRHSTVELPAHWTPTHARHWHCAKYASFESPIKLDLLFLLMKQLCYGLKQSQNQLRKNSLP